MKTSIKVLLAAILMLQGIASKAQNANGIYLNTNDYKTHKLSYQLGANDKLQLNTFLGGNSISVINQGKKVKLSKSEIFGYRLNNQDYRFYNNDAYQIIDTAGFTLYSREKLAQHTKGYKPSTHYFYSVANGQPIKELTIANLAASFATRANFRYSLQNNFRSDADLISFDSAAKQYKVKYLYFEHPKVLAEN
ncbi:hypothetical protein [Mucilaginibacter agri]|uniref:DUF3108 domain-containing protein n=1 Tax=Mucilaginibacter agri TaxID=2695265 RepID=A0A965ZER9_9SPHI|nr:hypothetical protein [Mucilaginibacter agri]NCD69540.1 hypothetical protein [Mucilaginibacter agri]